MLKTVSDLIKNGLIDENDLSTLEKVSQQFNVLLTPYLAKLMASLSPDHPIRKQFLPNASELQVHEQELRDPTGDERYEAVKGIVHRYPDRCLLKVVAVCPVYCRFCFRKELIGPRTPALTRNELDGALQYINDQTSIWEVILTGGDPLIVKPSRLADILASLSKINHVEVVRIHTRIPIADPLRVNEELLTALKSFNPVYIVVHINHPDELTEEVISACSSFVDAGIPLLSQTVLLKGINDDEEVLMRLMKKLIKHRIKPYYLHHPDRVMGTSHFRVPIQEGRRLVKALQKRISGLCQPTYVIEIPGGFGKMPIGPGYIQQLSETTWEVEDHSGDFHCYDDAV